MSADAIAELLILRLGMPKRKRKCLDNFYLAWKRAAVPSGIKKKLVQNINSHSTVQFLCVATSKYQGNNELTNLTCFQIIMTLWEAKY